VHHAIMDGTSDICTAVRRKVCNLIYSLSTLYSLLSTATVQYTCLCEVYFELLLCIVVAIILSVVAF
jgi:hypothetical protein